MVEWMLAGFGGDQRKYPAPNPPLGIECYHVNARVSDSMENVGRFQVGKLFRLAGYCAQAIWCRFRHGVDTFYYVPAPGKRTPLYRDWIVMLLCRPFFRRTIFHWHAAGLTEWLEAPAQESLRGTTLRLLGKPDLSVVLSRYNIRDGEKLSSRRIEVVGNGIPDPCPDFETKLLPRRQARARARAQIFAGQGGAEVKDAVASDDANVFKVLFLAHCAREKGLFDTLDGVALANAELKRRGLPAVLQLTVAGEFVSPEERAEFDKRIQQADLLLADGKPAVRYAGFVSGEDKRRLFAESDCLCFPTYYSAESFGLVMIEALAAGLPVLASHWRSLPEILPAGYPGLVDIRAPEQVANTLISLAMVENSAELRAFFLQRFLLEKHLAALAAAIQKH